MRFEDITEENFHEYRNQRYKEEMEEGRKYIESTKGFLVPIENAVRIKRLVMRKATVETIELVINSKNVFINQNVEREILVCPACVNHVQGHPSDFLDCKNEFVKLGFDCHTFRYVIQTVGQCQCYGPDHGERGIK